MSRFQHAAERGCLSGAWKPGLSALKREHRPRVVASDTRRLTGSIDVEKALPCAGRGEPRWDYGVGYDHGGGRERAHWVEVHQAVEKEVRPMLEKLDWLKALLREEAPDLWAMTWSGEATKAYTWVHTGKDGISRTSPLRRRIREAGLLGPQRELRLP